MPLYDNHNHCQFSFDGKRTTVEASARMAITHGLSGMMFTDHCDFHVPPMKAKYEEMVSEVFDVPSQQAEIDRVNALLLKEGLSFRIYKGIEIGVYKDCRETIRRHLHTYNFDGIVASCHYLDNTDPFWGGYYEGKDWKEAYGHYLETLFEEIKWLGDDFDIMGHYDYVTRYAPYPKASILYEDFPSLWDEILRYLSENGKALEINTKTYQDYNGRLPHLDDNILLRFKELGGETISLGSDSHDAVNTGKHFQEYAQKLKSLGFRYTSRYERRKLVQVPID